MVALAIKASECINESDKLYVRFNDLSADDVLTELEQISEISTDRNLAKSNTSCKTDIVNQNICTKHYVEVLSVLGCKYNKSNHKEDLCLPYQQLGFTLILRFPQDDQVVAGSISLLALIAKDARVRKRIKYQTEDYGINRPIAVLKNVLERAKEEEDEIKEALLAETLRKGFLFIGAICNDGEDIGLPSIIVSEGGLELILETADWFRLNVDISNWALWAIFILCYDNLPIKAELIRSQGIQIICRLLENNPISLEVNRHGIALLFDLMRENHEEDKILWNPWEMRKIAISSGLHNRIFSAMNEFADSIDIMVMGQEILVGTGFRGNIPKYREI